MMRQQLTNVSANNEELLRAYNKLKDENEKLKNANIVCLCTCTVVFAISFVGTKGQS